MQAACSNSRSCCRNPRPFGTRHLSTQQEIPTASGIHSKAVLAIVTVIVGSSVLDAIRVPIGRRARPRAAATGNRGQYHSLAIPLLVPLQFPCSAE